MEKDINIAAAAELLSRLVACPSVNPAGAAAAGPPLGEEAMADLLASILWPWGADTRKVEIAPGRVNFIARFVGAGSRTLLLEAHADTVSADGMTVAPFDPVVRDGRLYGRGSCDTKGPMAAMLLAIRSAVGDDGGRLPATLCFVSTADEEIGATGAKRLAADGFRAEAAVIGEPTDLAIINAHKGASRLRITARGRAAHSSAPWRGVSAIAAMARVVEAIEGPLAERLAARRHAALGPPTVSVGTIRGGTQVNVVPDRCEIDVDRRTLPGETSESILAEFRELLDGLRTSDPRLEYDIAESQWWPAFEEDPHGPIASLVASAARKVLGRAEMRGAPWTSNAGILRAAGIPCVLFGPGSARQAHTADEHIELEQVVQAARVYEEIIRGFGANGGPASVG
jgi:acetylornithine deacetylase